MLIILYASFEESPKMLLSLAIVASLSIIFKTYRCLPVLLMFLFFFTYVVNLIPFFFAGEYIFYYPPKGGFYETLFIHTIFLCTLDTFLLPIKKRLYINEKIPQKRNLFDEYSQNSFQLYLDNFYKNTKIENFVVRMNNCKKWNSFF